MRHNRLSSTDSGKIKGSVILVVLWWVVEYICGWSWDHLLAGDAAWYVLLPSSIVLGGVAFAALFGMIYVLLEEWFDI